MVNQADRRLRILTWHVHGSYLYYLVQAPHEFYLPVKPGRPEGYGGRTPSFPWPENVHDIPAEEVSQREFDLVLFQSNKNYLQDQFEILSETQRQLPRIYLEHDPPRAHPTDTPHPVDEPNTLLVHVTHFNQLMWDNRRTPSTVIDHGVMTPPHLQYTGEMERGLVVVNGLPTRGRRLGLDIFEEARRRVPLDLAGMQSEALGGLGAIPHEQLLAMEVKYRFIFNPIRYTSLGLAVCEAMMMGMPVIGLATTEMVTAVTNGISGYVHTSLDVLVGHMQRLLADPDEAVRLSRGAQQQARIRFNIDRFAAEWSSAFTTAMELKSVGNRSVAQGERV